MEIPSLIKFSSDPTWVFLLFVIFLVFFHVWLVFLKPIGNIGWKVVDYIWLGVAVLGLIGQSAQVRQHWYASTNELLHYKIEATREELKRSADFSIGPAICRTFIRTESSPSNLDQIQSEYNFACTEFTEITKQVRLADKSHYGGFLNLLDTSKFRSKLTNPILIDTLENLVKAHQEFMNACAEERHAKYNMQSTSAEFALIVLSPYLFMFALALRIAKVSGEIRLAKKQSRQNRA